MSEDVEDVWGIVADTPAAQLESDEYHSLSHARREILRSYVYNDCVVEPIDLSRDHPTEIADVLEADAAELRERAERLEEQAAQIRDD